MERTVLVYTPTEATLLVETGTDTASLAFLKVIKDSVILGDYQSEINPEGQASFEVDFSSFSEGIYEMMLLVDGEVIMEFNKILLIGNPIGYFPTFSHIASDISRMNSGEEMLMEFTNNDFLYYVYGAFEKWGFSSINVMLSKELLRLEATIKVLEGVLDTILVRDSFKSPDLEVDDSKIASRIQKRIYDLCSKRDSIATVVCPKIFQSLNSVSQPYVEVAVSQTSKVRNGVTVPYHLNTPPEAPNSLSFNPIEGSWILSWNPTYSEDFSKYVVYTIRNNTKVFEAAIFNNTKTKIEIYPDNISKIILEVWDSGGLMVSKELEVVTQ